MAEKTVSCIWHTPAVSWICQHKIQKAPPASGVFYFTGSIAPISQSSKRGGGHCSAFRGSSRATMHPQRAKRSSRVDSVQPATQSFPLNWASTCRNVERMKRSTSVTVEHCVNIIGAVWGAHRMSRTPAGMAGRRASSASSSALCRRSSSITGAAASPGAITRYSPSIRKRPPFASTARISSNAALIFSPPKQPPPGFEQEQPEHPFVHAGLRHFLQAEQRNVCSGLKMRFQPIMTRVVPLFRFEPGSVDNTGTKHPQSPPGDSLALSQ